MSETAASEAQATCKCGAVITAPPQATRTVRAASVGVSGGGPSGPHCAACDDELCHLYALFFGSDGLGFCGCGDPESAYALVRDILALAPLHEGWESGEPNHAKVQALTGERAFYFVLYAIDNAGLLEHGGSVGGSWLTRKGTHYLALMRKHDLDDVEGAGFPHSSPDDPGEDCGPGCPHWEASTEDYEKDRVRREAAERERAGDWQVLVPNTWVKLAGADASVLVKAKAQIKSRPGALSDGRR